MEPTLPTRVEDAIEQTGRRDWRVTLRWSVEAPAVAAYEITFRYMGKVGDVIDAGSVPKGWEEMSPHDAGRNAATMMLRAAVIRAREDDREDEMENMRAVALYKSNGFDRPHLRALLSRMEEHARSEYPIGRCADEVLIWQLRVFRGAGCRMVATGCLVRSGLRRGRPIQTDAPESGSACPGGPGHD
ncbi:MAG TPA: hypothetical protein VHI13_10375 [Candidatus Kapabacteria bacterium]|nr:hypothetical protein [Candidatus Kapabacteria bacterium]